MVSSENLDFTEAVGCRIESVGYFGVVRFIGNLPGHVGNWYGIEWDDPDRGKHNGTVNGVQYFQTKHLTSGSFVRREKINFGKSLIKAIITKYGEEESDIVKKIHEQQIVSLQKTIKAPFIEFVGFDKVSTKQSDFKSLKVVSVRAHHVSSIEEPPALQTYFPNIRQLDLSKNLFTSWQDVFDICTQLNQLYSLNVSENLLKFPESCSHIFPNITIFICGFMNLTWPDIITLSNVFPNINELRANNNQISDLFTEEKNNFQNLEGLDLEYNPIKSWDEIVKLKHIKSLNSLSIGSISLEKIDFKTDSAKVDYFHNLTKLSISNNGINDWTSVSELNRLPNLEELRFLNNPVLNAENADTAIALVVAKIGTLKLHNGRKLVGELRIGDKFRRGCEYDYLKKYGLEWLRVKNSPERCSFLKQHNRYLELIDLYGELQADELKVEDTSKLKDTLISLNLLCNGRSVVKRVSPSMLVQKLKILSQRLFKLQDIPELVCQAESTFEIPLDDETKELSYFSVKDTDTIVVKI
ncbi:tubulin-specific chaperone E [Euwallacea similis]|uniref:tubulin-specific chaperone E n=1 Tax=Euwallacea similis TaxID=1736056 RepID=UPI00344CCB7B